jgi:ATP-dependent Clp protease ATP-binding subunit ClpC
MSERFCRTKQLTLDEAGSRVHITNIEVPKKILDLERQLRYSRIKNVVSKKAKYEEAAKLRDDETHRKELAIAQEQWEEDAKNNQKLQKTMLQM